MLTHPNRGAGTRPGDPLDPKEAKKRKRRKRIALISSATIFVLVFAIMGAGYALVNVPLPEAVAPKAASFVYYGDGAMMARYAVENREPVKLSQVPKHVQDAVIAAEDRSFYTNNGISPKGIARAISGLVTGEDKGGGSTITQQYIKNAHLTQERSFSRKAKEIPMAIKADQKYSKEQILEFYLNTIYFGRGAYGIQAAARAFYNVPVEKLTPEQGAVIAATIKDPTRLQYENNPEGAKERWHYVLDGMAEAGQYPEAKAATAAYPAPIKNKSSASWKKGPNGVLAKRVEAELTKLGITEEELTVKGLKVYTTINRRAQQAAEAAVRENMAPQPKTMAAALAAVEPNTGKVRAYYGGDAGYGFNDLAGPKLPHPAGSSMKPYVLAKAIESGVSVKSVWNGTSGQKFEGRDKPLRNSENDNSCPRCTLIDSTVKSLNTVYWALTQKVGADEVARLANKAGITTLSGEDAATVSVNDGIGIGQYSISVLDQANGYATFAAYGKHAEPYFVEKVLNPDGSVRYQREGPKINQAFSEDVGRDATYVMSQVVSKSKRKLDDGRRAAGKTGTQQFKDTDDNSHAWMCGYTPQLAAAVWVGNKEKDGPLRDQTTGGRVYGSGIPGRIWKAFMDAALRGAPEKSFKDPVFAGDEEIGNAPKPPPPPTPSPDPEKRDRDKDKFPFPFPFPTQSERPRDRPSDQPTEEPTGPVPTFPEFPSPTPSKTKGPG